MKKTKILMACLGNICHSPLAEEVMRNRFPIDSLEVDSARAANYHIGDAPDLHSIASGRKHGVGISILRGKQFSITDSEAFDYVFVIDRSNYRYLIRLVRNGHDLGKISSLSDTLDKMTKAGIPGPYYGNEADFKKAYQLIDTAYEKVAHELATNS